MAIVYFSAFVICTCSGFYYYYYYGWEQTDTRPRTSIVLTEQIGIETQKINVAPELTLRSDSTLVNGNLKLMEPVNAQWDRNVFFAVKTTTKFLNSRLRHLMITWFQAVDKDMVSFN